ncbi:hypothetical protein BZG36_02866 [Bifiguratus adelaidae]|uniref:ADF-H domain-containing protein n=1 Tax=Bifiguratus adelaidae TaxID=1938954 RepID=A0A261Y0H0_9FUNG|nr:hypothetical protein BZG36_02866 [Bifiguratus adelaidae]
MSHQSGISVSDELAKTFAEAVSGDQVRFIRVSIVNEVLEADGVENVKGNWEEDFDRVQAFLPDKTPTYIFYRLDPGAEVQASAPLPGESPSETSSAASWILLCYVPDGAKIRDKMIYASTRATLKREWGESGLREVVYGTTKEEFSLEGYRLHLKHQKAEAPLTQRERDLAEVKAAETQSASYTPQGTQAKKTYAAGVAFPLSDDAKSALEGLSKTESSGRNNYVSLAIDVKKEEIYLDKATNVSPSDLSKSVPADSPRFTFYTSGAHQDSTERPAVLFIYTCPLGSKIKERMVYSSAKAVVCSVAADEIGLRIVRKLETSDPHDLTADHISNEMGPTEPAQPLLGSKPGFKRPAAPGRRARTPNS